MGIFHARRRADARQGGVGGHLEKRVLFSV
jgi:hypothetical protein